MARRKLNKRGSAKQFRRNIRKTAVANIRNAPMRGGFRM